MRFSTIWRLAGQVGGAMALLALPLTAAATNPTLTIRGTGGTGTDVTAFVDNVQITNVSTGTVVSGAIVNGSFETPVQSGSTGFSYGTTGGTWTISSQAGIAKNGSNFGAATAPDGTQVALLQGYQGNLGAISQQLTLGTGQYRVSFQTVQRNCCGNGDQTLEVLIDGVLVGSIKPTSTTTYTTFTSSTFTVNPPTITGLSASSAPAGTTITVTGTNFTGATAVTVNGLAASSFTVVSATSITCVVPAGTAATGTINVTTPVGTANSSAFAVLFQAASLSPAANARTAPVASSAVGLTFTESLLASSATAANLRVFSGQVGGTKVGTYSASGSTLGFVATAANRTAFRGGEQVQVTATAGLRSSGNIAATPKAYQFYAAASGTGRGYFPAGPADVASTGGVNGIGLGDVNNDGIVDMLIPTGSTGTVLIRLGTGTGTFTGTTSASVGGYASSVTTADLNNDGNLDMLVPNISSNIISVLLGNGSGSFTAGTSLSTGSDTRNCIAADLNNDGNLDLIGSPTGTGPLYYLGTGSGTFGAGTQLTTSGYSGNVSVVAADFDNDGWLDLAVDSYYNNAALVFRNLQNGSFSAFAACSVTGNPNDIQAGDMNGDGLPDIIVPNGSTGFAYLRNTSTSGTISFATSVNGPGTTGAGFLRLADINADGTLDVLTANSNSTLGVFTNNGSGTFTLAGSYPTSSSLAIGTADLDNDGDVDVATTGSNVVNVRLNQGTPTISSFSPSPGGLDQLVTITGTDLNGATSLTVNGVTATIVGSTTTTLTFQVPVTASATGTTTVTTGGGSGSSTAFTVMPAPGNALAFDGTDDYVAFGSTPAVASLGTGSLTLEAWVYYDGNTGVNSIIRKDGDYNLYLTGGKLSAEVWYGGTSSANWRLVNGSVTLPANHWTHVAATWNTTGTSFLLYVNGVLDTSTSSSTNTINSSSNLNIGLSANYGQPFKGRLDEVRIYTTALTAANIQADMLSTASAVPASLKFYLNFDQGTPGGTNTGLNTVYDLANNYAGTLTNFALSGSTSNWVESYAMVVPTATAATLPTTNNTSFVANWTAPTVGTVTSYLLDVSTTSSFSAPISGSPFTAASTATSYNVTGLTPGTTYYYRVRADKTSVTGQGDYSNVITVTVPTSLSCAARANNALNFDGSSDYVRATGTLPATSQLTLEAWVYPTAFNNASGWNVILNGDDYNTGSIHCQFTNGGVLRVGVGSSVDANSSFSVPLNAWSHVAIVYSATASTLKFYLNGALQNTVATSTINIAAQAYCLGGWLGGGTPARFFTGSLNEVRVWNVARTDAQIAANYNQALAAQTGLAALYSFDQGTAGGTNTSITTLNDDAGQGRTGTLNTFALTGSTSNWVAGNNLAYTLAVASFSPANGSVGGTVTLTGSGFLGATGVSFNGTAATTFTVVSNTTITVTIPSGATTGLISVTGPCGTVSSSGTFMVCPNPAAVAQNVTVTLPYGGIATVAASTLSSGSTPTSCGTLTSTAQKIMTGYVGEGGTITLTAPAGMVFTSVLFASYGTPSVNSNGTYTINSSCHASTSQNVVETALLNKNSATIGANNTTFGDPCVNTVKTLAIIATYGPATPTTQLNYTCAELGTNKVLLTVTDASGVSSQVIATVTVNVSAVTTTTWLGTTSTDWYDCRNWSYGQVPSATVSAVIDGTASNGPTIGSGTATVNNISIAGTSGLTIASTAALQVSGNWTSTSTAGSMPGMVTFLSSAAQTISQPAAVAFGSLVVNKASGQLLLSQHVAISNTLTMTKGLLTTGSNQVQLGLTATITEDENNYVIGNVAISRTLSAGISESFNGLGITLMPKTGSTAPGATTVVRTTGTALTGAGTSQSVQRYFDITPTINTGLNVDMTFNYFTHELNSIPSANLMLFKSTTSTSGPWTNMTRSSTAANSVTKTGLTDFSIWTLGNSANPLPVELLDFTATAQGPAVALAWHTASENNSDRFEIERSVDGAAFGKLGAVAAHGTTTAAQAYAYRDALLPSGAATLYYRLRQVDLSGTFTYSPVRTVAVASASLALFPNPTHAAATLTGATPNTAVLVLDAVGRTVLTATTDATGTATLALPAGLPAGVYVVRAGRQAARLTVE